MKEALLPKESGKFLGSQVVDSAKVPYKSPRVLKGGRMK
jgi:hypothetical protein